MMIDLAGMLVAEKAHCVIDESLSALCIPDCHLVTFLFIMLAYLRAPRRVPTSPGANMESKTCMSTAL